MTLQAQRAERRRLVLALRKHARGKPFSIERDGSILVDGEKTQAAAVQDLMLAEAKADARRAIAGYINALAEDVIGQVPQIERDSWPLKEVAARALKQDPTTLLAEQRAILEGEADLVGETIEALADTIIVRAGYYREVIAELSGHRRKAAAEIDGVTDPAELEAVVRKHRVNTRLALDKLLARRPQ